MMHCLTRPLRYTTALALFALLSGCFVYEAGEDPYGEEFKRKARPALKSVVWFNRLRGRYPTSQYELTPMFLDEWPKEPKLQFDESAGQIHFTYTASWPKGGQTRCAAKFGKTRFTCEDLPR